MVSEELTCCSGAPRRATTTLIRLPASDSSGSQVFAQIANGQNASFYLDLSQRVRPSTDFGDYFMLASAGCGTLYAAWVTDQSGLNRVYVNRIDLADSCNIADFDASGLVNATDALAFTGAFAATDPAADVNHDQALDTMDVTDFYSAWSSVPHQP
jgi:hypothetical protein